eukprot:jgi/Botrbrau1/8929/Bobra.0148s0042.1
MLCYILVLGLIGGFFPDVYGSDVQVYFIDAPEHPFLRIPSDGLRLSAGGVKATVASILAVDPPTGACHEEAEAILQPDVFHRPTALATIHIAGLTPGDVAAEGVKTIAGGSPITEAAFDSKFPSIPGTDLVVAVAHGTASPVVLERSLDTASLVGCDDACTESALQEVAEGLGAKYISGERPMQGRLQVGEGEEEVGLDLSSLPLRLLASEVAGLSRSSRQLAGSGHLRTGEAAPHVLEATLVGLQAVRSAYGRESPQYEACWQLLSQTLAASLQHLRTAYNGSVVMQVGVLGEVPNQARGLKQLLSWGEAHRRRSLLSTNPLLAGAAEEREAQDFANKAAGVISFLLFLLFSCQQLSYAWRDAVQARLSTLRAGEN